MAYARFDDDSDVYCYQHVDGKFRIIVAGRTDIVVQENAKMTYLYLTTLLDEGCRVPEYALARLLECDLEEDTDGR